MSSIDTSVKNLMRLADGSRSVLEQHTWSGEVRATLRALAAEKEAAVARRPDGYAYEYPGPFGGIQFSNGGERNGSKPIRAIPFYFNTPQPAAPSCKTMAPQEDSQEWFAAQAQDARDSVATWPDWMKNSSDIATASFPGAIAAPSDAGAVPEGWQLVPKNSTDEMHIAYTKHKYGADQPVLIPGLWRAMLAAAPEAPQPTTATAEELIGLTEALEQKRALHIASAVRMLRQPGDMQSPFDAGFDLACEEILHRLQHEKWELSTEGGWRPVGGHPAANDDGFHVDAKAAQPAVRGPLSDEQADAIAASIQAQFSAESVDEAADYDRMLIRATEAALGITGKPAEARGPLSHAAQAVLAERERQVTVEGWTPEHDDAHTTGGMAVAAACYAGQGLPPRHAEGLVSLLWPFTGWARNWFKPRDQRRNLVKAGALILAEIERLDRAGITGAQGGEAP